MDDGDYVVVVGGGIAAVSCVETLARECPQLKIKLISASPLLKVATNLTTTGQMLEHFDVCEQSKSYLEDSFSNVQVIIAKAVGLDAKNHRLKLDDEIAIGYNKLCICTGGRPKLIEGVPQEISHLVLGVRDTETVETLQKRLEGAERVLLVGNGGIATELVYEITDCEVVWTIKDDSIGAPFFDAGAARFFMPLLERKDSLKKEEKVTKRLKYTISGDSKSNYHLGSALGPDWSTGLKIKGSGSKKVTVEYSCEIKCFYKSIGEIPSRFQNILNDTKIWPIYVQLSNDKIYGCAFIVSATGVIPSVGCFLDGNDFKIAEDGGLVVNQEMLTTESDVYAAGDVCSVGWSPAPRWFQMRLWTQARLFGVYAGFCLASHLNGISPMIYFNFEVFTHVTKFFGFKVILLGLFNGQKLNDNYEILLRITPGEEYVKVVLQDGKMQGAILIGETDLEETFENLIMNQLDLTRYGDDLLNSTIDIDDYFD